jgi:AAA family ATP:ADP antiporter
MAQGGPLIAARGVAGVAGLRPDERGAVGWSFALFFCVLASWYALRPLRDALGIAGSARELPRLFLVTLGATFAVGPLLSALVSRVARKKSIALTYRLLAATLVAFFVVLRGPAPALNAARAFFVWASVINLVEITLAWALMADVFTREQGVRLFALVGAGGTLGGIVGSAAAAALARLAGPASTLLAGALLLEGAVRCVDRIASSAPPEHRLDAPCPGGGVIRWLGRTLREPFFLGICAYLALFTFSSTVLYLEQGRIVKASLGGTAVRTELFARMDLAVNCLTLLMQLFVVGRIIRRIGLGLALAALPLLTIGCFLAIRAAPVLVVLVVCQVARRALDFSLTKPAREVLFTVVRSEDKYKAKSFIDTFVYRSGDALAAASVDRVLGPFLLVGMAALCAAWAVLGLALGRARPRHEC